MKLARFILMCLVAAVTAMSAGAADTATPTRIMSFNPPDSVSFVSDIVTSRARYVDTLPPIVDSTHITTNYLLTHAQNGFLVTGTQVATDYFRNGERVENDISRLSTNITVTTELNKNGAAIAVRGYDVLFSRIDSLPDKKTAEALRQVFKPSELAAKDVSEWNSRMSHVIDKALKLGITRHDTSSMSVGDGSTLRFFSVTDFADTIRVDGRLSLRVRIASDTDPLGLARNLSISPARISALFELPDSMMTDGRSSASGFHSLTEFLVDIETLLILRESQRREVVALVPSRDGRTVVTRMSESLDKVFDFDM